MSYRANKIRQRLIERIGEPDFSWIGMFDASTREHHKALDPKPVRCDDFDTRHFIESVIYGICGTFAPRPGYEQDRSKYE